MATCIIIGVIISMTYSAGVGEVKGGEGRTAVGQASSRADINDRTNDFAPQIVKNSPVAPFNNFSNAGGQIIVFNITVTDQDIPFNGSHISNATLDLGEMKIVPNFVSMEFWPMPGDDTERRTGRWVYNWSMPYVGPGKYKAHLNVFDKGNLTTGNWSKGTFDAFDISIHQENRPPYSDPYFAVELTLPEETPSYNVDLGKMFRDDDIRYPKENTDPDHLTFDLWTGTGWAQEYDFGGYSAQIETLYDQLTVIFDPNYYNVERESDPGGDVINVMATDSHNESATNTVTLKIYSVSDLPAINDTSEWPLNENVSLVTSELINTFVGYEDTRWRIRVVAWDNDLLGPGGDMLSYYVANEAELPYIFNVHPETGVFDFTPMNAEVGKHLLNVTVEDENGNAAYKLISFIVENVNDEPHFIKVHTGGSATSIFDHHAQLTRESAAVQDELYEFTLEAVDVDPDPVLAFTIGSGPPSLRMAEAALGGLSMQFNFTPDNDDALVGYVLINISVRDGVTADDFVILNISVVNVNDPPVITKVDGSDPPPDKLKDRGRIERGDSDIINIQASDIDLDELTCRANWNMITIEQYAVNVWVVSFEPSDSVPDGNFTVNITVSDGMDIDFIHLNWYIQEDIPAPYDWPNHPPMITVGSQKIIYYELGDMIVIEGTIADPDASDNIGNGTLEVMVEILLPGDIRSGEFNVISTLGGGPDRITYSDDGIWSYTFDTSFYEINDELRGLMGTDIDLTGTYRFYFKSVDDGGLESEEIEVRLYVEEPIGGKKPGEPLSMGLFAYDIIALNILILVIILIAFLIAFRRFTRSADTEAGGKVSGDGVSEIKCPSCGSAVSGELDICLWCGTAVGEPPKKVDVPPPPAGPTLRQSAREVIDEYERERSGPEVEPELVEGELITAAELEVDELTDKEISEKLSKRSEGVTMSTVECPVCGEYYAEGTDKCGFCGATFHS